MGADVFFKLIFGNMASCMQHEDFMYSYFLSFLVVVLLMKVAWLDGTFIGRISKEVTPRTENKSTSKDG